MVMIKFGAARLLKIICAAIILAGLAVSVRQPLPALAAEPAANAVNIYFFWGDGCPHCAKAKPVLQQLDRESDAVKLYMYEVYYNVANQKLLQRVAEELQVDASGVPVIVIGDEVTIGYSDAVGNDLKARVRWCTVNACGDSVAAIVGAPVAQVKFDTGTSVPAKAETKDTGNDDKTISLPLLGAVRVKDFSLPFLTVVIAALDGFNPCAMWTLLFLISLLLGMENRKRMWVLGSSFIMSSALVYFLFLTAWLNIFLFIGFVTWVKILIGLVALGAGGYYLRDFYMNRSGTCKVTGNEKRQKVFERIREITHHQSFWLALGGIVLLAFAVNLVELVCSAGLPAVYTGVLSGAGLPSWQYYSYLALYILVFMLDDLFVFVMAMLTLRMAGVHGSYARYSHLIGGILMLVLGILLIFAPQLLMFG